MKRRDFFKLYRDMQLVCVFVREIYIYIYICIYLYIYVYILYTVPISELPGVRSLGVGQDQHLKQEAPHVNFFFLSLQG